jgi:hypothetical protein
MLMDRDAYAYPFPFCKSLPGYFGGCCGNCKWPDRAARCTNRDEAGGAGFVRAEPSVDPVGLLEGPGSQEEPIEVKEETDDDEDGAAAERPIVLD